MMNAIHFSWWWSLKSVSSHTAPFRGLLCLAKLCCLASKCSWDSAVLSDTWQSCGLRSGEDVRPVSCCFRNHFQVKFRGHLNPRRHFLLAQGHILYLTWKQKEGKMSGFARFFQWNSLQHWQKLINTHVGRAAPSALMPDSIYQWLSCKWESKAAFSSLRCSIICFNVPSSSLLAFSLKKQHPRLHDRMWQTQRVPVNMIWDSCHSIKQQ